MKIARIETHPRSCGRKVERIQRGGVARGSGVTQDCVLDDRVEDSLRQTVSGAQVRGRDVRDDIELGSDGFLSDSIALRRLPHQRDVGRDRRRGRKR